MAATAKFSTKLMAATAKFSYLSSLPAGFVFRPTEEQLITHYLKKKNDGNESVSFIKEIDLYKFEPEQLPDKSFIPSDNFEWFFFRASTLVIERTTGTGSWKSSGDPRPIKARGTDQVIGSREIFVFHRGRGDKGVKTNWVIHEYKPRPVSKIPSKPQFVIFRLKNENADGQSSSVASQTKKKNITQKPGAGTSKNPDNAIQSVYDFEKHITESVFGKHKNLDQMTSNKHEESDTLRLSFSILQVQGDNTRTLLVNPPHPSTKRIHHNSTVHPVAKLLLGIGMFKRMYLPSGLF
ncbi:NAC domain-containing protein 71-like isoform X2 [Cucurbita moschata]|uniref:NAC domain-containing protein 71-like isoform X2 n=1 Tax=Cucurbita moschata TaxID=3662 RepID=A0A6J1F8X1_CUCMO|nr:NAC domain-containing protein 71-like isoform X2 [Cucurbita moschata]